MTPAPQARRRSAIADTARPSGPSSASGRDRRSRRGRGASATRRPFEALAAHRPAGRRRRPTRSPAPGGSRRARTAAIVAGRQAPRRGDGRRSRRRAQGFARAGFSGTWAATEMAVSVASAGDRIAAAAAFEEAAMAAVVEDLVDEETLEILRATTDRADASDDRTRRHSGSLVGPVASGAPPAWGVARRRGRDRGHHRLVAGSSGMPCRHGSWPIAGSSAGPGRATPEPDLRPRAIRPGRSSCRMPVRGQEGPAVDRPATLEVGRPATGLLEQEQRRGGIPG